MIDLDPERAKVEFTRWFNKQRWVDPTWPRKRPVTTKKFGQPLSN